MFAFLELSASFNEQLQTFVVHLHPHF